MNKHTNQEVRDLLEKESPKNIVVSFLLAMMFAVSAGLAAIAYSETLLNFALQLIYSSNLEAAQYVGFKRVTQITSLTTMCLGWLIAFMVVWHKIERKPSMATRIKYGVTAIVIALAIFGAFELVNYVFLGDWLRLNGGILLS